jgi:hypothetical protein
LTDASFKVRIVYMILIGKVEDALEQLAKEYQVSVPALKVGLPKGHKATAYGCYASQTQTISLLNSDMVTNPFVVLHEFYHHIRSKGVDRMHRGTEGNADKFAIDYVTQYQLAVTKAGFSGQ